MALWGPLMLELAADQLVQTSATRLRRKTFRRRVAKASAMDVRRRGIGVSPRALRQWLAREDVQRQMMSGNIDVGSASYANLRWRVSPAFGGDADSAARELVATTLYFMLAESEPAHATAISTNWLKDEVRREGSETRRRISESQEALVDLLSDSRAFSDDVRSLHPWRAAQARLLVERWPTLKVIVSALVAADDRKAALTAWSTQPPGMLRDASAEVLCWMGQVASDYGARTAAVHFFAQAIDLGAQPRSYWLARSAQAIAADDLATAEALLEAGGIEHPLGQAIAADIRADHQAALGAIEQWTPDSEAELAMKAVLACSWRYLAGEENGAIAQLVEAAERYPESSGLALRAAEMLLWRVQGGNSLRRSDDVQSAMAWALKARNARRAWGGDSSPALKVAIAATGLLNDLERGYRLTQQPPVGEATPEEASDPYVAKQGAILAAMLGHFTHALELAIYTGDEYTQATVRALQATNDGDAEAANIAWQRAFDTAPSPMERLQTAHTMLGLGEELPDIEDLSAAFPEQVAEMRALADLPRALDERLIALRALAPTSQRMTVELAAAHSERGEFDLAGQVMEDGGSRWSDPLFMKMAADRFRRAGDHESAKRAAEAALDLAAPEWGGETETRMILFDAYEMLGDYDGAKRQAGALLALDAKNADARWALIYCLIRQGDLAGAWSALTPDGEPIPARDHRDARAWVSLLTHFDSSEHYLRRILSAVTRWREHEEVVGTCMAQVYLGLKRHGREPAEADITALHDATRDFLERFPSSEYFRAVDVDPEDPLAAFTESLRARHDVLRDLAVQASAGQLPLGFIAEVSGRTYTEVALQSGPGPSHSHQPVNSESVAATLTESVGSETTIDLTAAATLAKLGPELGALLLSRFSRILTTDVDLHDALAAQTSLGLRSNLTVIWDEELGRARPVEIDEREIEELAEWSSRVVSLLTAARVGPRPKQRVLLSEEREDLGTWLSALDLAAARATPIWSDDRVLQALASEAGIPSFGTVDLVRHLVATDALTPQLGETAEAILIANFHVDLGFNPAVMKLAADLTDWRPGGPALALSRPLAWIEPESAMAFLESALLRAAERDLDEVGAWTAQAARGLVRGLLPEHASSNLCVLLGRILQQSWMRPDRFPTVLAAVRRGVEEVEGCSDPAEPVLTQVHATLVERHGYTAAASLLMNLVQFARDEDRQLALRIVLRP